MITWVSDGDDTVAIMANVASVIDIPISNVSKYSSSLSAAIVTIVVFVVSWGVNVIIAVPAE